MKTKILFVQNFVDECLGPMYLSSALKKKGYDCAAAIGRNYKNDIFPRVVEEKPDVIGISIMTFSEKWALEIARNIKRDFSYVKVVFGGPHPTYFHEYIDEKDVDIMVTGEGEEAFVDLVDALTNNSKIDSIKNVYCKVEGKIYRNPVRPVVENIDDIEFPDRELYLPYSWRVGHKEEQYVLTTRGCPFSCTYCYNNATTDYYGGEKKRFVRLRSVDNVFHELEYIRDKIKPRKIFFVDDYLGAGKTEWLYSFLPRYAKTINIPFYICFRANLLASNPGLVKLLKEAGCFQVGIGVECGNERIRNEVIGKRLKDRDIIAAAENLHREGIYVRTCNLLGIPGTALENEYETIALNQKIKTEFPHPYLFYPFPKTALTQIAIDKGLFKKDNYEQQVKSFHGGSILDLEHKTEIENIHKLFQLAITFPFLMPIIKKWVKYEHPRINKAIFKILLFIKFKKYHKVSWTKAVLNLFR
jgi:anaerobic magnesium-protoporphyrin IX monomethyl ester cyclase